MLKKLSFNVIVTGIVFIAFLIVSAMGIFTYLRLTNVVNNSSEAIKPKIKLVFLKQILYELSNAESSAKSYILTRDTSYLTPYYHSVSFVDDRMNMLQKIGKQDTTENWMVSNINRLVVQKYNVLNELLTLNDDERVTDELKRISNKIDQAIMKQKKEEKLIRNHASQNNTPPQKTSFFKKLFGKNKPPSENLPLTAVTTPETINIKVGEIKKEVKNVKQNQIYKIRERKQMEFSLMLQDKQITNEIRILIDKLEVEETANRAQKIKESVKFANETKLLIGAFCILAILIVVIVGMIIAIYVKKNTTYQIILQKEKTDAENLTKLQELFLANMSHEIRTPMNAIVGFTDLMLKTPLSAEQKQYISAVKTAGENLIVVINDILDISKIKSGKISLDQISFKLSEVMTRLTELMLPKSLEKNIQLSTVIDKNIPDFLMGDPARLNQILLNLVSNAIKFTEQGIVKTTVNLLSETDEAVELEFSVEDTGIGIPKDKLSTVFDAFIQASNETTRKYGGTGLGLSIVKQFVDIMGGTISVQSKEKKGSTFTFHVTFKKDKNLETNEYFQNEENEIIQNIKGINILLVEDNILNQTLAKKVLTDWDWQVEIAGNGVIAIDKLRKKDFDIILMDVQMPEMDGYETTSYIRKNFPHPKCDIPIMAMTAHAMSNEEEKCREIGMNGYISKPFDQKILYNRIISTLNSCGHNYQKNKDNDNYKPAKL